jgi:hypothetical protein
MGPSVLRSPIVLPGLFAVLSFLGAPRAHAQESARFSLEGVTVTAGAGTAASPRFDLALTVAELEPSGAASFCNQGFGVVLGAAPFTPALPVPNHLIVDRNALDPAHVDLSWSGTAASYDIYRSTSAGELISPNRYLASSQGCLFVDADSFVGPIVYYTVVPTGN